MAPTAETVKQLRWSQEETDILRQMTNDQLELEAQDRSMMISWTSHWKKVSARLKEHGFNRSATACRGIWKRGVGGPRTNKDAAGPDWDDTEHEILVHMTKKQLRLEEEDPANEIPWTKHWEKVSLQLEEEGYSRTADNCDAYWQLVESGMDGPSELDDDEVSPEPQAQEDVNPSDLTVTSPQLSKSSVWSSDEYENLLGLLKARRSFEVKNGLEQLDGKNLWVEIAKSHRESGYDRTLEGCKTFWNKQGRARSGFDERERYTESSTAESSVAKSNGDESKLNVSFWSPVNGAAEESVEMSRNPTIGALRKFQKEQSVETPETVSSTSSPAMPKAISPNFGVVEFDHDLDSSLTGSGKKQRKKGVTNFRLMPEQRAVLEAEVAKSGIITSDRKQELAQELDLEYKTVRNWFTNYNVKARRSQGSIPIIPTEKSVASDFDEGFDHSFSEPAFHQSNVMVPLQPNETASPSVGTKRPHSRGHDGLPHDIPPSKKAHAPLGERHLQRDFSPKRAVASTPSLGFNPVNGRPPVNQSQPISSFNSFPVVSSTNAPPTAFKNSPTIKTSPSTPYPAPTNGQRADPSPQINSYPTRPIYKEHDEAGATRERTAATGSPATRPPENRHEINNNFPGTNGDSRHYLTPRSEASSGRTPLPGLDRAPISDSVRMDLPSQHIPRPQSNGRLNVLLQPMQSAGTAQTTNFPGHGASAQGPATQGLQPQGPPQQGPPLQGPPLQAIPPQGLPSQPLPPKASTSQGPPPSVLKPQILPAQSLPSQSLPPHSLLSQSLLSQSLPTQSLPPQGATPQVRPSTGIPSMSPPAAEDERETAYRMVRKFGSEIESLKQSHAVHHTRILGYDQQISSCAQRRTEVERIKQNEIQRTIQEIERRYEGQISPLRQQEVQLQNSRGVEVEGLARSSLEISKKEKGLVRWQGIIDFYEEGDDS